MSMSKPNFDVNLVKKGNRFIVWSFFNENLRLWRKSREFIFGKYSVSFRSYVLTWYFILMFLLC